MLLLSGQNTNSKVIIESDAFFAKEVYLRSHHKQGPQGLFESFEQYARTISMLNSLKKDDLPKFQEHFHSLGIDKDFKIRIFNSGDPFNPYSNYEQAEVLQEMTLHVIATCYKSADCLNFLSPATKEKNKP